jgi:hypothetical protein
LLISCCRRLSMLTLVYVIWISLWSFRESPNEDSPVLNLTQSRSSAFFPSFRYAIYTTTLVLSLHIDLETLFLLLFCVISQCDFSSFGYIFKTIKSDENFISGEMNLTWSPSPKEAWWLLCWDCMSLFRFPIWHDLFSFCVKKYYKIKVTG